MPNSRGASTCCGTRRARRSSGEQMRRAGSHAAWGWGGGGGSSIDRSELPSCPAGRGRSGAGRRQAGRTALRRMHSTEATSRVDSRNTSRARWCRCNAAAQEAGCSG